MKLLIPGGAGYIGSHMVKYLQEMDLDVVVLDNFSSGHSWAITDCEVLEVNLLDVEKLSKLLKGRKFDGVIHFAAKSLVGESNSRPDLYYNNNVAGTLNLLNEMLKNNINNLVFSSTAAIFGNPVSKLISEDHIKNPINAYGRSKLMIENIFEDVCSAYDFNVTSLRYFNAAGAHESGKIGEAHNPETHLIPNILNAVVANKDTLKIFGDDYPTYDGTCIRDYIHVNDLSQAHLLSFDYMKQNKGFSAFNLGNGNGYSVLDIIKTCAKVTGKNISYDIEARRPGDPSILVADSNKALSKLNWRPEYNNITDMISSAWKWHKNKIKYL